MSRVVGHVANRGPQLTAPAAAPADEQIGRLTDLNRRGPHWLPGLSHGRYLSARVGSGNDGAFGKHHVGLRPDCSLDDERPVLAAKLGAVPDLFFDVQHLVVDDGYVACRIGFDCTPCEPFQGTGAPTGAPVVSPSTSSTGSSTTASPRCGPCSTSKH